MPASSFHGVFQERENSESLMNTSCTLKRCSAAALALVASLSSGGQLAATQASANPDSTLSGHDAEGDDDGARPMSRVSALLAELGRNALARVDAAAASLSAEDPHQALMDLQDIQYLLEQIRPHALQDLIPVFVRIGPTAETEAQQQLTLDLPQMIDLALQGHQEQVLEQLRASGLPMGYIQVSIPLENTLQRVQQALRALHQAQPQDAQLAVESIIDSLHTTSITVGDVANTAAG